jgi:hypothetical protein
MPKMPLATITVPAAEELATRLASRGVERTLAQDIAVMETECRQAARLIRVLLRHVNHTDVFQLPPE